MENAEVNMSGEESIELIASMINKAKNRVSESGTLYVLWGCLILICCLVQFVAVHFFNYTHAYYIWFSTWILLVYQIFYIRKKRKSRHVRTYTDEINAFVWIVFLICMMLTFFIGAQLKQYAIINPLLLMLYGMPTFLSGIILKFKALITGGICCWLLSVISVFTPVNFQALVISAAVILAWIIPGILLKRNFKRQNGV